MISISIYQHRFDTYKIRACISSKISFFIVYPFNEINMDINNYVFINRKVLKFVGLYPTNIMRYIICCTCMITIVIPQGLQIYQNWQDLSTVLETRYMIINPQHWHKAGNYITILLCFKKNLNNSISFICIVQYCSLFYLLY